MDFGRVAAAIAVAVCCAGCASIVNGSTQSIFVTTTPEMGALCVASNARGQWSVTSPGTVTIGKSDSVLAIRCSKAGWQDGTFYASGRMSTAGLMGALIPYAGVVSTAVDASSGATLTYPETYIIEMKPMAPQTAPPSPPTRTSS
jgi:hypothetical protein